jgi:hypothetical protein
MIMMPHSWPSHRCSSQARQTSGTPQGLRELSLVASMNTYGATANTMVAECARAIADGTATTIACVFADTPLRPDRRAGAAWSARDST